MATLRFPEGFLWGSATSAHQIEGGNNNDWSEWEKSSDRIAKLKQEGKNPSDFISGKACDSYNRYEEDFDIAQKLNQKVYRFSIEWSRIEPEEGKFNQEAIEHYKKMIDALRSRGIEPMVTLWHFTNPIWFAAKGGFLNPKSSTYFTRFINYTVDNLKDRVGWWITFNEAGSIWSGMSFLLGQWPPMNKNFFKFIKSQNNFIKSHRLAYQAIKKIYNSRDVPPTKENSTVMSHNIMPMVGIVENLSYIASGFWIKLLGIDKLVNYFKNTRLLSAAFPYYDFIGLNYYTVRRLPGSYSNLKKLDFVKEMDWEIYPEGIYHELKYLNKFRKPVIITENGIADSKDDKREKFIKDHLSQIHRAISEGVDVRGYIYWSLLDNFEWARGFEPRFGLVEINYQTLERTIRPSALAYSKICAQNTLEV